MKIIYPKYYIPPLIQVDDEDFDYLSQYEWEIRKSRNTFYAHDIVSGKSIHRMIMHVDDSKVIIDHKDGNGLNNQKKNLRIATASQNSANRRKTNKKNITSIYKGVHKTKWGTFTASVKKDGKRVFQKTFKNEIDAAKAYNENAIKYHDEFAYLNTF
jgi:hypothetical protein